MDFVAIDVETANPNMASICQIGAVRYINGRIDQEWKTYIDPYDYFDEVNIAVHGINEKTVLGSPDISEVWSDLNRFLSGSVTVCHTHFDRVALNQAAARNDIPPPDCVWLDSAMVARRAWSQFSARGYGIENVCDFIGYKFRHHDALEDAKAAGSVMLAAIEHTGLDIDGWIKRVKQPIDPNRARYTDNPQREGNPEGPMAGEVMVFTGKIELPRPKAADIAANIGCRVHPRVTKKTTILVVGDQDIKALAGHKKSSKHRMAESLILKGHRIRILCESDFLEFVDMSEQR